MKTPYQMVTVPNEGDDVMPYPYADAQLDRWLFSKKTTKPAVAGKALGVDPNKDDKALVKLRGEALTFLNIEGNDAEVARAVLSWRKTGVFDCEAESTK